MKVRVKCFGSIREMIGRADLALELAEGTTAGDAWRQLCAQTEALQRFERSIALAVNMNFAPPSTVLHDGDEMGLLPPVSGGSGEPAPGTELPLESPHARLQREVIDSKAISESIHTGEDGALCIFDGTARNNTRGRRTLYLEYEAYPAMAIAEMEKLVTETLAKFPVRDARLVHRVGRLEIGESSVVIVVASAHRVAAFEACRWLIDTLKKRVPVWKKEYFEDGAVWADGESFPPEVPVVSK